MKKKILIGLFTILFMMGCDKQSSNSNIKLGSAISCGTFSPTTYLNTQADFAQFVTYTYAGAGNAYLQPLTADGILLDPYANTTVAGCSPTSTQYNGNFFAESAQNSYDKNGNLIKQDIYSSGKKVATMSYTYSNEYPSYLKTAKKICSSMDYSAYMHYDFFYNNGLLVKMTMTGDKNCITPPAGNTNTITYEYNSSVAKRMPSKVVADIAISGKSTTTYEYFAKDNLLNKIIYNTNNSSPIPMTLGYENGLVTSLTSSLGSQTVTIKINYQNKQLTYLGDSRFAQFGLFVKYNEQNKIYSTLQNTGAPETKPIVLSY